MTPKQLFESANTAKANGTKMTLVLPVRFKRPKGFPRGELMSDTEERGKVYSFDPDKIINFLQMSKLL